MRRTDRRSSVQQVTSSLLCLALFVISVVIVSKWNGDDGSSSLTIEIVPTNNDADDDGLRSIGDDDVTNFNATIIHTRNYSSTALPTYSPSLPSGLVVSSTPSVMSSTIEESYHSTLRPTVSSSVTHRPSKGAAQATLSPMKTPLPKLTTTAKTSQSNNKSPATSSSSSRPTQSVSTVHSSLSPTTSTILVEPETLVKDQTKEGDSTLLKVTNVSTQSPSSSTATEEPTSQPTRLPTQSPSESSTEQFTTLLPTKAPTQSISKETFNPTPLAMQSPTTISTSEQISNNATKPPTQLPTALATSSPTKQVGTLVNFKLGSGDRSITSNEVSTVGIIFEVQALRDLAITSLSTFTESEDESWSEVWIRHGRYEGNTASADAGWERVYFERSQQHGGMAPLDIVFDDEQIFISEGHIMSFYLVSPGKFLSDQGNVEGHVIAEDNSLRLYTGAALDYGRWEDGCSNGRDCILPARVFNGAISYVAATLPPTAQPTPDLFQMQASGLTLREEQWLDGHNVRRKKWHGMYGKKYKPLKWSEELKDMAQAYADKLAVDCGPTVHDSYDNRHGYGENLASNTGRDRGADSWGELKPVDSIMYRFVERESTWMPPKNGHFTQVLWYATTHVGCADSAGEKPSGVVCRYQVCRYARAGNCNLKSFNDGSKEWWMKAVMTDSSLCRPFCPPEGC